MFMTVKAKPHNKTEDLILKIKDVMGFLDRDTVAKAYKSYTVRIEAVVIADGYFQCCGTGTGTVGTVFF
jgi:hypothetical protein